MSVRASNMDQPQKISRPDGSVRNVSEGMGTKCGEIAPTASEFDPRIIGDAYNYEKLYGGDKPLGYDALRMHTMDCETIKSTVDGNVPGRGEQQAARIP